MFITLGLWSHYGLPIYFSVWRICVGLSLIPAFATLYQRLTLPESKRYEEAQKMTMDTVETKQLKSSSSNDDVDEAQLVNKAQFKGKEISCLQN
jgi:hypothetical protein